MVAYGFQGLSRPIQEPINRGTVHERWVLPEVALQLGPSRAHEEKHVEVALAPLAKERRSRLLASVLNPGLLQLLFDLVVDLLLVLRGEERS